MAIPIGRRILAARQARGMSQKFLAKQAELSPAGVRRIEMEQVSPQFKHVEALAQALGIPLVELCRTEERVNVLSAL